MAKALVEATGRAAEQVEELPEEEGGIEAEVEQVNSQMEEEVEELGTEEQEEDQECFEEPSELGDPAVMRAVRSKPTLEVMCEQTGGSAPPPSIPTPLGPAPQRAGRQTFNSPFLTEPGLGGAGQQDWDLLGRVWQGGLGKNVPTHLVMRQGGSCGVPCSLLLFTCLMPTSPCFPAVNRSHGVGLLPWQCPTSPHAGGGYLQPGLQGMAEGSPLL